jgi:hypothetical protein
LKVISPRVARGSTRDPRDLIPGDFDQPLGGVGRNAISAATGKRIGRLPIRDQLTV